MPDRAKQASETREKILDAAAIEFSRYGFSGARLDRVVAATHLTKGAFYFHFNSKQGLADSLLSAKYDEWPVIVAAIRSSGHRGISGLKATASRVATIMVHDLRVRAAMRLSQELHLVTEENNPYSAWTNRLIQFLLDGVQDGDVSAALDLERASRTIVNCLFGVVTVLVDSSSESALDEELEALWELITPGLNP